MSEDIKLDEWSTELIFVKNVHPEIVALEIKKLRVRLAKAQDWLKPYWDDLIEDTDNYRVRVLNRADFAKLEKAVGGSST